MRTGVLVRVVGLLGAVQAGCLFGGASHEDCFIAAPGLEIGLDSASGEPWPAGDYEIRAAVDDGEACTNFGVDDMGGVIVDLSSCPETSDGYWIGLSKVYPDEPNYLGPGGEDETWVAPRVTSHGDGPEPSFVTLRVFHDGQQVGEQHYEPEYENVCGARMARDVFVLGS